MNTKLLTLEQAHKSGRKFRKEGQKDWKTIDDLGLISGKEAFDKIWEIEEKSVYTRHEVEWLIRKTIKVVQREYKDEHIDSLKRAEIVIKIMEG